MNFKFAPQALCVNNLFSSNWSVLTMSTGPLAKTSKTLFGPVNFQFLFRYLYKINSRIWFGPVNSNFHFKDWFIVEFCCRLFDIYCSWCGRLWVWALTRTYIVPTTIKLVFDASLPSTHHEGVRAMAGWFGIRIMCWELSNMSTHVLLFQWASSIGIQFNVLV
jgi:hypothetical protein